MIQVWAVKAGCGFFMRLQGSSFSMPSWKRYVLKMPRPIVLMWIGLSTASRGPNNSCKQTFILVQKMKVCNAVAT